MDENRENIDPQTTQPSVQKKRKHLCGDSENQGNEDFCTPKKRRLLKTKPLRASQASPEESVVCSIPNTSPPLETPERRFWRPFKERLIESGILSDEGLTSPRVRNIYRETDTGGFFSSCIRFDGKTVFQADDLFDSDALALSKNGVWETNLDRMKRGLCPIGLKGIFKGDTLASLSSSQIRSIRHTQRKYRIELQHMTQKDTGLDDDPICEMTHDAHMGEDTRHIVKKNTRTGKFEILASSLKLLDALSYLESHPDCIMVANVLHFRGDSLIDRNEFALWRTGYWIARAEDIEASPPKRLVRRILFMEPISSFF